MVCCTTMQYRGSGKVFFLLPLAAHRETRFFATPEGGTRGIHLAFRTRNVGDSRWRMRGQINECPNTFKQMHFPVATREVYSFLRRRRCESPSLFCEKNDEVNRPYILWNLFRETAKPLVTIVIPSNECYEEIMMYRTYNEGIRDTKWELWNLYEITGEEIWRS